MNDMIEVKTAGLIGPALDWAVAKAEGMRQHTPDGLKHVYWYSGDRCIGTHWQPSTSWSQCGPLIEKYAAMVRGFPNQMYDDKAIARVRIDDELSWRSGDTPLIALCRAIAEAKLGETIQVPTELITQ
ncbi:phage protein NinX family protein [Pseudomonas chlororaphis]|uniref:phage protein NinX family protein n=1 Tax=Pseudomonas chlororaphis TaxID=587753 RepID=UPI000472A642|nr:phage protein NinX family protein [Pseudomonas chlororaphis]